MSSFLRLYLEEISMNNFTVASFYQFIQLTDCEALRLNILKAFQESGAKGTVILAEEGMNGSISGTEDQLQSMKNLLNHIVAPKELRFLINKHIKNPFEKAKVKLRKEIVTMGIPQVNPNQMVGTYLTPEEWNTLLQEDNVMVIDVRNGYEIELGTFHKAIDPKTANFRDFPTYVESELMAHKDKKIAMCCTGGIRCEKSTAYLKSLGFPNVYHLKGGILTYLEEIPKEQSLWEGSCFVFDDRVAVDHDLNALPDGTIDKEWKNKKRLSEQNAA